MNKYSVQYIIVGGTAVALHGYFRPSTNLAGIVTDRPDLDLWYNPTYENYFKLLDALEELGQDVTRFREEQAPDPKKPFFKYEFENFTLDFLPELKSSLTFTSTFGKREVVNLKEVYIPFISYDDLIQDKETSLRAKDIADIQQLKYNRKVDDQ